MNDPNAPLRGLLDSWATGRETIPPPVTEGIEAPPRSHDCETATTDDGVKGEERRQERPLTPATGGATYPAAGLACGDVVCWTSHRSEGYGQVLHTNPGSVTLRPFVPIASKTITVSRERVTFICHLCTLTAFLEQSR